MSGYFQHLHCSSCGQDIPGTPYTCPHCDGILETVFQYDEAFVRALRQKKFEPTDLLPVDTMHYLYMGQGNTPLVHAKKFSKELGVEVHLKCEYQNPTGSFKDRPVSCGVSKAAELGYRKVVVASSGNGAAATAAFAAKAGLEALVFVPESTPDEKVKQAMLYGGQVIRVPGAYSAAYAEALRIANQGEAYNVTTTFINPFTPDGDKVVAYEIYQSLGVPDAIYVPIGAGPLLVGIAKGFEEMKALGIVERLPKMVGVQAEGCSPIARAFREGQRVTSAQTPNTIAGGICDGLVGYEQDGDYTIAAIRRTGGDCLAIPDMEISDSQRKLAQWEGIFVEPSSAAAIAAIRSSAREIAGEGGEVVALLTGHGLKDMKSVKLA